MDRVLVVVDNFLEHVFQMHRPVIFQMHRHCETTTFYPTDDASHLVVQLSDCFLISISSTQQTNRISS